jgi:hypothetical protein
VSWAAKVTLAEGMGWAYASCVFPIERTRVRARHIAHHLACVSRHVNTGCASAGAARPANLQT